MLLLLILTLLPVLLNAQSCPGAQFYNGQRCAPCLANCQCSQQNTCSSCLPGYTYDALFQNCLQCPTASDAVNVGCQECCYQVKGPAFVCSKCPAGDFVFQKGGQCLKVMGCTSLSSQGVCTSCLAGYYLHQGACTTCDVSCATCYDSSLCLTCASGYYNATDAHASLCQPCPSGCSTCMADNTCQSCLTGHYLSGTTCPACGADCDTCTAGGCSKCSANAVLIGTTCHLCTDIGQQGSVGCTSCVSTGTRVACTVCADGYYLNPTTQICYTCHSKFPNSILCDFNSVFQCQDDAHATYSSRYLRVNNQCVSNIKNCKDMADIAGNCNSCYFSAALGYYSLIAGTCTLCNVAGCSTYSSSCQCLSCQDGFQFINNQCLACQSLHCKTCQTSVTSCEICNPAYGRLSSACQLCTPSNCFNCDGDNTQCSVCQQGYYLNNGLCYACQTNCAKCTSNRVCSQCNSGYFLQNNGRCKMLPGNCIDIDKTTLGSDVGSCKRCEYGYILLDGNCYPCGLSVFNLQLCNDKHCPNYYQQLTFEPSTHLALFLLALLLLLTQ